MTDCSHALGPCPVCGATTFRSLYKVTAKDHKLYGMWRLGCGTCGMHTFKHSKKEALNLWNKSKGLKDNQISGLVNAVRDATKPMVPHQCLRGVIARTVVKYLGENNLRRAR